ncbi:MAG: ABC transporter ATP-binding protein [Colwellia polaris]|jgi:ABC-type multidrug transport system ATPase subunit
MSLIIDVQQVTKKYGNNTALNNVEFSLESGAPVALVGPNGAGKTTLFSVLCGYIQPTSGNINILGHSPGNSALFGRLSALPQDAQLDPRFSIAMQLNFYARLQGMSSKQAKIDTLRVLDMVGLQDATKSLPAELSHGMRKRATIAQALLGSPEIVMLDEATAGLDPANAKEIRAIVAEHADNVNFILSSHDLNELERLCDRVLYLESGHLKQHQTQDNNVNTRYITLRVKQAYQDLIPKLSIIPSVEKIEMTQDKEYLLTINSALSANNVEIDLLKILIKNNWLYSHIINGKTLENQLF